MTLCSFVVAFFMNIIIQRWWSIRLHLQGVIGSSINLMMLLMPVLSVKIRYAQPDKAIEVREKAVKIADEVKGQLVLCLRLLFNRGRHSTNIHDLVEKGFITAEDEIFFSGPNANPLFPLCKIAIILQEAKHEGFLGDDQYHSTMNLKQLLDLDSVIRQNASFIVVYITTQLPYPFVQIVSAVVYAFMIQLLFVCSSYISTGIQQQRKGVRTTHAGHGYLTIILYSFVLIGILKLFQYLSNPLGTSASDFPGDLWQTDLENTLNRIVNNALAKIPSAGTHQQRNGVEVGCTTTENTQSRSPGIEKKQRAGIEGTPLIQTERH